MEIPGLGIVSQDEQYGWYQSEPIAIPVLKGTKCRLILEDYADDRRKEEFHAAIRNFLSID